MQEIELNEEMSKPKKGFWRRQFQTESTAAQRKFDWMFGVVLPVACFFFDPVVFKGAGFGKGALFGSYKPFAYLLSYAGIMATMAWLIWGAKLKWTNAFLAGLFLVGGFVSLGIGIILLPYSVLGLFIIVGAFGFTPLFSGFVYLRSAFLAYQAAVPFAEKNVLLGSLILTALFSLIVPIIVNVEIEKTLNEMLIADPVKIYAKAERLKYVYPLVNFDKLGGKYCRSPGSPAHRATAEIYQKYTGESIERIDFHICEDW